MSSRSDGAPPIIEARGLTKRFGDITAVDSVDLTIRRGEIFGLLGPNGAGKTTTIQMLVTLLAPTEGYGRVNGYDVVRAPHEVRRSVGIVFQEPSLDTILTGRENLELHGRLYGVPRRELGARVEELLELVDLRDRADDLARTYSGGMKRRLEIARGLLHRPAVLFLDEPTLGLDPQTREYLWDYIEGLKREHNTTVVLTTHYMEEADALCDRLAIIDHGRIIALDAPAALKRAMGGDVVRLQVRDAPVDKLEALPFVREVEASEREVALTVENAGQNLPRIIQAAGAVEGVEVRSPTLNDVFLHHTGRALRDTGGEESAMMAMARHQIQGGS